MRPVATPQVAELHQENQPANATTALGCVVAPNNAVFDDSLRQVHRFPTCMDCHALPWEQRAQIGLPSDQPWFNRVGTESATKRYIIISGTVGAGGAGVAILLESATGRLILYALGVAEFTANPDDPLNAVGVVPGAKVVAKDLTYLYQKLSAEGKHLKFGITKNPTTRYTQAQLAGGKLNLIAKGSKKDMLKLERELHETLPIGPEEGQLFYIQKQIDQRLVPPPYDLLE